MKIETSEIRAWVEQGADTQDRAEFVRDAALSELHERRVTLGADLAIVNDALLSAWTLSDTVSPPIQEQLITQQYIRSIANNNPLASRLLYRLTTRFYPNGGVQMPNSEAAPVIINLFSEDGRISARALSILYHTGFLVRMPGVGAKAESMIGRVLDSLTDKA